jgi:hypothetical protein
MEAWPTSTSLRSMEQGRLRTYVHPAVGILSHSAQARVFGRPRIRHPGRLGEPGGPGSRGTWPGAAGPERARSAHSLGWRGYNNTCNGHRRSPQAESCRLLCSRSLDSDGLTSNNIIATSFEPPSKPPRGR